MRGARHLVVLVVLVALASTVAHARRPLPIVVLPFAEEGPARELSDALELELELAEALVLSSPQGLYDELGAERATTLDDAALRARQKDRLADALAILELQALVYGVVQEGSVTVAVLRTNDAAVVFAERVALADAPVPELAARLVTALGELHERSRVSDEELVRLGLLVPEVPAEPAEPAQPDDDDVAPPPAAAVAPAPAPTAPAELPAGLDRLGRVTVSYAPSFLYYRACQPADPSRYTPFACAEKPGVPSTEVVVSPLEAPLGGALALELFPVPFLGLEGSATLSTATLRATVGDGEDVVSLSPDAFQTVVGDALLALVARVPFGDGGLGGAASVRAGYHLGWAVTDEVTLDTGRRKILFPLLPTYSSHHALLGGGVEVGLGPIVRLALDADALLGPHLEGPVLVGNDAFAVGGRARLALDVALGAGLFASAALEGSAVSVGTNGTAPEVHRYTLALEPFESGQLLVTDGRFGIGFGYRY